MRGEKGTEQTFDFVLYFLFILCYNSGREWNTMRHWDSFSNNVVDIC